jgi:hypothetical protein
MLREVPQDLLVVGLAHVDPTKMSADNKQVCGTRFTDIFR